VTLHIDKRLAVALADRYTIERKIGAGGMATVYLAHDQKHQRKVAVKVLHPDLAATLGGERFLSEIRTTANLQHPHILPLHDSGAADGFLFYVMPYIEGESLRERLEREKQLPIDDAVRIAKEVASALDYAHRRGVIHRDIKPENILLHDGAALVADFGIALAVQSAGGQRMTQTGLSLGTPQYMSPEQALGERSIDARADQYALGAVTYEMLVGEPPFTGPTVQSILARVMTEQPRGLSLQRKSIPPAVEVAVLKALDKLPADRFNSAAEFSNALSAPAGSVLITRAHPITSPVGARNAARAILPWAITAIALLTAFITMQRDSPRARSAGRIVATLTPEPGDVWREGGHTFAVSPDGQRVVLSIADGTNSVLAIRSLDSLGTRRLANTTGASFPFWSPRGDVIAFFADGFLKTIQVSSGAVRSLCPAIRGLGGDWSSDDVILYTPAAAGGLFLTSPSGQHCEPLPLKGPPDAFNLRPYFFPETRQFIATNDRRVWLGEVGGDSLIWLADLARARAILAPPNYIIIRPAAAGGPGNERFAQQIDLGRRKLSGEPIRVAYGVSNPGGNTSLSASWNGVLVGNIRISDRTDNRVVTRVGLNGVTADTTTAPPETFGPQSLSHDGSRVAFGGWNISVLELNRGVSTIVAENELQPKSPTQFPQWSPGDTLLAFSNRDTVGGKIVYEIDVVDLRSGNVRRLMRSPSAGRGITLTDWSSDGRQLALVMTAGDGATNSEAWTLTLGDTTPRQLFSDNAAVDEIRFAPNGKWIAYQRQTDGSAEIFIRSMPGPGSAIRVSTAGGRAPRWNTASNQLYYLSNADAIMAVTVGGDGKLSTPRQIISAGRYGGPTFYDPIGNGEGFVATYSTAALPSLTLIVDWWKLLDKTK
jgi:eukaryotic-like serine/threonine-protein kinase